MGFFSSSQPGYKQISTLGPEQKAAYQGLQSLGGQAYGQLGSYYNDLMSDNSQAFQSFAAPEQRRFREQTVPDLAEQFAGMGSGALSGSGFRNAAVSAGTDLSERLGAIRAQLRAQGAQGLQSLGQQSLQPFYENVYEKPQGNFMTEIAPLAGTAAGAFLGGPGGAAIGNALGGWISGKGKTNPYGQTSENAQGMDRELRMTGGW